jgi:thiol:disulfide interchange protein
MLRQTGLIAAIGGILLTAGCSSTTPAVSASASKTAAVSPTAAPEAIPDRYDSSRNPAADVKAALRKASADHKEVLIDFGANWCPDCRVLDKLFHSGPTTPLLQQDYHVVAVDVGDFNLNKSFVTKYVKVQKSGIPALVVMAPDGAVRVATNDGSFANARTMDNAQVDAFLTKWAPRHS